MTSARVVELAVLRAKRRNALPDSAFALPGRRYPIHDLEHARNALSRVAQYGTPEEQRKVRAAVARKYGDRIKTHRERHHDTSVGDQKDLSKPAGYADHKPPYDFKHGWIPVSGAAKTGAGKRVEKPEDVTDEIKAKLPPMLKQKTWQHETEQDWVDAVNKYMEEHPEGFGAAPQKASAPKRAVVKVETGASGMTEAQQQAFDAAKEGKGHLDLPSEVGDRLMAEWTDSVKVKGKLTVDEEDAIAQYQWGEPEFGWGSSIYEELNDYKRNGTGNRTDDEMDELQDVDENMATALFKSKTAQAMTVFRGLRDGQPPVKVGDVLTDKAWVSASFDPFIAHKFAENGAGGLGSTTNKVQVISLPEGHPALRALSGEEMEIVLGPDTPFKVVREDGRYQYLEPAT